MFLGGCCSARCHSTGLLFAEAVLACAVSISRGRSDRVMRRPQGEKKRKEIEGKEPKPRKENGAMRRERVRSCKLLTAKPRRRRGPMSVLYIGHMAEWAARTTVFFSRVVFGGLCWSGLGLTFSAESVLFYFCPRWRLMCWPCYSVVGFDRQRCLARTHARVLL